MSFDYDLFVIGGGSGGVRAARTAAATGARVGLAEESRMGGTCVIRGCVPKKLMVFASAYREVFEDARGYGWAVEAGGIDWPAFRTKLEAELDRLEGVYQGLLDGSGVQWVAERAVLEDPHTVRLAAGEELVETTWDVLGGHFSGDGPVLVYDDNGQHPGPTCAEHLAGQGADVEIVTPERQICQRIGGTNYPAYLKAFHEHGVTVTPDHWLQRVERDGQGGLRAVLVNNYTGAEVTRGVAHVLVEHGTLPLDEVYTALKPESTNDGEVDLEALRGGRARAVAHRADESDEAVVGAQAELRHLRHDEEVVGAEDEERNDREVRVLLAQVLVGVELFFRVAREVVRDAENLDLVAAVDAVFEHVKVGVLAEERAPAQVLGHLAFGLRPALLLGAKLVDVGRFEDLGEVQRRQRAHLVVRNGDEQAPDAAEVDLVEDRLGEGVAAVGGKAFLAGLAHVFGVVVDQQHAMIELLNEPRHLAHPLAGADKENALGIRLGEVEPARQRRQRLERVDEQHGLIDPGIELDAIFCPRQIRLTLEGFEKRGLGGLHVARVEVMRGHPTLIALEPQLARQRRLPDAARPVQVEHVKRRVLGIEGIGEQLQFLLAPHKALVVGRAEALRQ